MAILALACIAASNIHMANYKHIDPLLVNLIESNFGQTSLLGTYLELYSTKV